MLSNLRIKHIFTCWHNLIVIYIVHVDIRFNNKIWTNQLTMIPKISKALQFIKVHRLYLKPCNTQLLSISYTAHFISDTPFYVLDAHLLIVYILFKLASKNDLSHNWHTLITTINRYILEVYEICSVETTS